MAGEARISGTLAIVGGGRMGEAILGGLLAAGLIEAEHVVVAEPNADRRDTLTAAHGVTCVPDAPYAVRGASVVLLAVKPQVIEKVATSLAGQLAPGALVVSIAVGVSCARLESVLPAGTAVVRVMPNTPALVREGVSVVSGGTEASDDRIETVRGMFSALGKAIVLDEHYQDSAAAISGSGPAYAAMFVDALARAGVRQGLPRDIAQMLAAQTLRGTVGLLDATGQHPEQLVDAVTSPGGTTIAAVEAMEARGFRSAIAEGVAAAVRRAKELGS